MLADVQVHDEENHALPTRLIIVPFLAPVEDLSILVAVICSYCAQRKGQPLVSHPTQPRGSTPPSA